jgi:hypothetical protein
MISLSYKEWTVALRGAQCPGRGDERKTFQLKLNMPGMVGAELALDSLDVLGLILADEIAETRIGMVQGVERRGECTMYGQGATKHGRIGA